MRGGVEVFPQSKSLSRLESYRQCPQLAKVVKLGNLDLPTFKFKRLITLLIASIK